MTDVLDAPSVPGQGDKPHKPNIFEVFVAYNGVEQVFTVNVNETVQVLLNNAIQAFHISAQPHILSIYNSSGVELPDQGKLGELGVTPKAHLLLRPSTVKGGRL
jgi:Protein of Unknown function (DUF2604)